VLETASGKVARLEEAISARNIRELRYALIYATDKEPEQLKAVNELLGRKGILYHQLTSEETRDRVRTRAIIEAFQRGDLQVLTAKRVLDEGVNLPEIKEAFILASTTVERQWVQRRGRLLRKCPEIGKTLAKIHDFVCLPPEGEDISDADSRSLSRGELRRIRAFASLARNAGRPDGPLTAIKALLDRAFIDSRSS
jgi:superfamily II DNA or RNA helicase